MKKIPWNTIIFLCYLAYCVFFFFLFWCVFDNNEIFHRFFNLARNGLLISLGINTVGQIIAIIAKRKHAFGWLITGILSLFLTIGFTYGQGV